MRHLPPPTIDWPPGLDSPEQDAAMLRAYQWPRMLDYGMSVDDAAAWHRTAEFARHWIATTCRMGDANASYASELLLQGFFASAMQFELYAAACYRLAQSALEEHASLRRDVYLLQAAANNHPARGRRRAQEPPHAKHRPQAGGMLRDRTSRRERAARNDSPGPEYAAGRREQPSNTKPKASPRTAPRETQAPCRWRAQGQDIKKGARSAE